MLERLPAVTKSPYRPDLNGLHAISILLVALLAGTALPPGLSALPTEVAATPSLPAASATPSPSAEPILVVSPAEARADYAAHETRHCRATETSSTVEEDCLFGIEDGTRTVVLVGDSHAGHWFPAMEAIAERNDWRLLFWTKGACTLADVRLRASSRTEDTTCPVWRRAIFERLEREDHIDLVLYARAHGYRRRVLDEHGTALTPETLGPTWEAGTRASLGILGRVSDRIAIIADTPVAPSNPIECLSEHLTRPSACAFPAFEGTHPDASLLAAEKLALSSKTQIIDFTDVLCPGDPCPVVSPDGLIIYRDRHHMTGRYSRSIADIVERRLLPLFAG